MTIKEFCLRALRKVYMKFSPNEMFTDRYVQYFDQEANDYIAKALRENKKGLMVAKFGTTELDTMLFYMLNNKSLKAYGDMIHGRRHIFENEFPLLLLLSGFFPCDPDLARKFKDLYLEDIKQLDILASYIYVEHYLHKELSHCVKVNLDGYYAPFMWNNPWTKELKGKKVLVVHPFTESIKKQYERREKLFDNPDVLPEFKELILIKAVQTIAGNKTEQGFETWFDALEYMKTEISKKDFDVALIGCGAYGLPLAAHVKRMGKIAVHLAGWTQMLFGIYGNRWLNDQPEYAKFINEYWVRPSEGEKPQKAEIVENGCYW